MSLEVDGRQNNAPIPYQREEEGLIYLNGPGTRWHHGQNLHGEQIHEKHVENQPAKPKGPFSGKVTAGPTRPTFFWIVLFCFISVLAVVAAGITGSMAARRGKNLDSCMSTVGELHSELNSYSATHCSTPTHSSNANNSSTADGPPSTTKNPSPQTSDPITDNSSSQGFQDSQPGSFIATSDCSSLSSPYVPSLTSMALTSSNVSFDIKCGTDYSDPDADFLTVAVFTFEDCIAACASFNERLPNLHPSLTCYIASYGLNLREIDGGASPSCRLKASKDIAPAARPGVSYSALLITG